MEISTYGYQRATNIHLLHPKPGSAGGHLFSTNAPFSQAGSVSSGAPQRQNSIGNNVVQLVPQGLDARPTDEPPIAALPVHTPADACVWVVALERNPGDTEEAKELFSCFQCYPVELTVIKLKKAIYQRIYEDRDLDISQEYEREFDLFRENPCRTSGTRSLNRRPLPFRDDFMQLLLEYDDPIDFCARMYPYFAILTRLKARHWDQGMRHWQFLLMASHSEPCRGRSWESDSRHASGSNLRRTLSARYPAFAQPGKQSVYADGCCLF